MNVSGGWLAAAAAGALLWVALPAFSHGPSPHKAAEDHSMSDEAMKAQHERMEKFKEAASTLSDAIIHNMMKMANEGAEQLENSLAGHERDVPHKNPARKKEFLGYYADLGVRTAKLKAEIRADDLPKAAVAFGRILETCAACHRKFRD